jgi:hypothetical protein
VTPKPTPWNGGDQLFGRAPFRHDRTPELLAARVAAGVRSHAEELLAAPRPRQPAALSLLSPWTAMRTALGLATLLLLAALPSAAAAQALLLPSHIQGDLPEDDHGPFRDALRSGLAEEGLVTVRSEAESAPLLADDLACSEPACRVAIGERVSAQILVQLEMYAEAEIYDFQVRIWSLQDGALLHEQSGECTFCPLTEASESLRFVARSAIASVSPLPDPTPGPTVAQATPDEPEPEPPAPTAPAWQDGDIVVRLSVIPTTATLRVNGQAVGQGSAELRLAPQSIEVSFEADGHASHTEAIRLTDEMTGPIFLRVRLDRTASPAAERAARTPNSFQRRATGGVLIASGTAAVIGGIVLLALDGRSSCSSGAFTACPEVYETTAGGATLTTLGALAAGAGAALLLTSPSSAATAARAEPARSRSRFAFSPPIHGQTSFSFATSF